MFVVAVQAVICLQPPGQLVAVHAVHAPEFDAVEYRPLGHVVHCLLLVDVHDDDTYLPAGQFEHALHTVLDVPEQPPLL